MSLAARLAHSRLADQVRFEANRHLRQADEARRLLVVGSGLHGMRGYLLERLFALGYPLTLVTDHAPSWERAFIDAFVLVDLSRPDQVADAVVEATQRQPVRGCLTYVEDLVPLTALLSRRLGLGFYGEEVAERVRDKALMRERLREAGLPMPRSVPLEPGRLRETVARVGLPAVLKPACGEGSINVRKLTDEPSLEAAERLVAESLADQTWHYGGYLVEEYLDGAEYSVESVVSEGRVQHASMTDKYKGAEPYFEEISHTVPALLDESMRSACLEMVTRALHALGVDSAGAHTELKIGSRGPVIIECAGRLGGGRIPRLVDHALGIDLADAIGRAALGLPVTLSPQRARFASVGFFIPAREQVQPRSLVARPLAPGLAEFEFWAKAGQRHGVPPDAFLVRLGYAVTVADTYLESREELEQVRELVSAQTGLELLPFPLRPGR